MDNAPADVNGMAMANSLSRKHASMSACYLVLALTLTSCASMAPPYEQPLLPVAATYPDTDSVMGKGTASRAATTGWQDYFADPRLRTLITQALEKNRDLYIAVLRVEEARAAYGIQRSTLFPTIGVGANGNRSRTPADLSFTGQSMIANQYQVGVSMSAWEIDLWGRVRSLNAAALETFLATDAARRAVAIMLVAQVADAYLSLRELDERVALAHETVASRAESFRIFKRRAEVGSISKLDLTQVETLLTQAQSLLSQLERARAGNVHALTQLVGAPATAIAMERPENGFFDTSIMREIRAGLPSDLLVARPDIIAAEHQLRAANANIGAARAAFFPRISLTAGFGTASAELGGLFKSGSVAWSFAPQLLVPIFDGGRNRAGLDLAEVRRNLAVATYEKTMQGAFREVSDALSTRHWLTQQVRDEQATLISQKQRTRLAILRYNNGAAPYLEVLDAQRDLLAAEQQLVKTRRELLSSHVSLYTALGGGAQPSAVTTANTPAP